MGMRSESVFEKDFSAVQELFPKLKYASSKNKGAWIIKGELDICDQAGRYWGTFQIGIFIPAAYPFVVPVIWEQSHLIPRKADWHISQNGVCCLDIHHRLLEWSRRGIKFEEFMLSKVYPYFANQLYRLEEKVYAGEEYKHGVIGVAQFYQEDLCLNQVQAVAFLEMLTSGQFPGRNDPCPCGMGEKMKYCHKNSIAFLQSLGRKQLLLDLANFQRLR